MLESARLDRILFLDVETVSSQKEYRLLPNNWKKLWDKKASFLKNEEQSPEDIYSKAGIYAEFGKVICISLGLYREVKGNRQLRVKSFYGDDEKVLLKEFCSILKTHFESPDYLLCAHNGKEFDFPFLARRILINRLPLPYLLDIAGRKPWEVQHLDTLQLWKFGDFKHYTSLELLTALFGIKSPKSEMDGSDVNRVYWEEKNLKKIVTYCERDVVAIVQLLLAYKGLPEIKKNEIKMIN